MKNIILLSIFISVISLSTTSRSFALASQLINRSLHVDSIKTPDHKPVYIIDGKVMKSFPRSVRFTDILFSAVLPRFDKNEKIIFAHVINTKKGQIKRFKQSRGLIVLNDAVLDQQQIQSLNFDKVKSISVTDLGKETAIELYGNKGKRGAIVIKTNG